MARTRSRLTVSLHGILGASFIVFEFGQSSPGWSPQETGGRRSATRVDEGGEGKYVPGQGLVRFKSEVLQNVTGWVHEQTEDAVEAAKQTRVELDSLGGQAVVQGLLSQETFLKNYGRYMHQLYRKHELGYDGLLRSSTAWALSGKPPPI